MKNKSAMSFMKTLLLSAGSILLVSCSTTQPVVEVETVVPVLSAWNQVVVQAVESNATLAEESMRRVAISSLKGQLDVKLEQERKNLEEEYPVVATREFILHLRSITAKIEASEIQLTMIESNQENDFWIVKGRAEIAPDLFLNLIRSDEEIWRVFQHSQWIQTLQ